MFLQARDSLAPGAEPNGGSLWPGGRVDLEDANQRIDNSKIILDLLDFLKRGISSAAHVTGLVVIAYKQRDTYYSCLKAYTARSRAPGLAFGKNRFPVFDRDSG